MLILRRMPEVERFCSRIERLEAITCTSHYSKAMKYEERPWGSYQIIHVDQKCQVKKLVVNPGKRLSLQSHRYRAEHWFVVSGMGIAQVDSEIIPLQPGDSVDIPILAKHRITCGGEDALIFIEVQTGTSFDEMDIVRFEDDFGRATI